MMRKIGTRVLAWLLVLFFIIPIGFGTQLSAQSEGTGPPPAYVYTQEQLDLLLAPIALYPDVLLSQILMASTYPLEVVEADRWLKQNPGLTGDRVDEAVKDKPWDVSIKSLARFPQILSMMDEKLQQTTDLGNAFLGQQDQVMDTIQRLRLQAQTRGNLNSTEQQRVTVQDQNIIIEPAYPDVIYIPAYDPCWVYGPWWYPTCAPLWFWYPGFVVGPGFFWGPRIIVGPIGFWCGFSWHRHAIFINVNRTAFINRVGANRMHGGIETWRHDPGHRRGVAYHNNTTAQRFGRSVGGPGVDARRPFRGFAPERRAPAQVRPLSRTDGFERQSVRPRQAPSGNRGLETTRSGNAFQGFGRSGIESRQQSERGWQSLGSSIPRGVSQSPGGFRESGGRESSRGGQRGRSSGSNIGGGHRGR